MSELTRRAFLARSLGCAALSDTALLSSLLSLRLTRAAVAASPPAGYRALVCVFLSGGNDSFNLLVPADEEPYEGYRLARRDVALAAPALHPIHDPASGRSFGLHPAVPELAELYRSGRLAFIANVGTLVEPITRADFARPEKLPLGLFSHRDQQREWQTSLSHSRYEASGWAGRMAEILTDPRAGADTTFMSIALDRVNVMQTGRRAVPYVIEAKGGIEKLAGYGLDNPFDRALTAATDRLSRHAYEDPLERSYARVRRQAIDAAVAYDDATRSVEIRTEFPGTRLGDGLRQVARAIGARGKLGHAHQIFFVEHAGWDHHDALLERQEVLLAELSRALKAFHGATVELGVADRVVTFTISDFGRTLSSNGRGTDHAWGGNQMILGGGVRGGRVYGRYPPSLAPDNEIDVGRGVLIPTTSVDEYHAELAMWFGLANDSTLEAVLPNLRNFYPATATAPPLGWMGARPWEA